MKISLNLTQSQAEILAIFSSVNDLEAFGRKQRVLLSLMSEISKKIKRFSLNYSQNSKSKKISFTLYQADVLEVYLNYRISYISNTYTKNTLLYIIGQINQQLS